MAHWNRISFGSIESILNKKEKIKISKLISSKLYEAHYGVCHPRDARMLTTKLIRYISTTRKFERRVASFASEIRQKILCLHEYNLKIGKIYKYPMSKQFNDLLIKYIELECESLYARNNVVDEKEEERIRHRVVNVLQIILYDALYNNKLSMKQNIYNSRKAVLNLFVRVRADCARENKLVEDVIVQLLEYLGLLDQVNQLKGKNIAFHQDSYLSNPLVKKIRESLMTQDFEENDDFATDQIPKDSLGCFNDDDQPINNSKAKRIFSINGNDSNHDQFSNEIQNSELNIEKENNLLEKHVSIDNDDTECVEVVETNQQQEPIETDFRTPENRETSELSLSIPDIITIELSDDEDDIGQIQRLPASEIKLEEEDEENRSPNFPLPCSDNNQDIVDSNKGNKESNSNGFSVLKNNSDISTKTVEANENIVSNEEISVEPEISNNVEKQEISSSTVELSKIPDKRSEIVGPPTDKILHEPVNVLEEGHDVSFSEISTEISQIASKKEIPRLEKNTMDESTKTACSVNKINNLREETELGDSDDAASICSTKTVEETDDQEQDYFLCGIKVNESFVGSSEIIVMSKSRFVLDSMSRETNKNEEITENIQQSSEVSNEITHDASELDNQVEEQRMDGNDVQLIKESTITKESSPDVHFKPAEAEFPVQSEENITEEIHKSNYIDNEEIIESSITDSGEIIDCSFSNSEDKKENSVPNYQESSESILSKERVPHNEVSENIPIESEKISKENINTEEMSESVGATTGEIYATISPEISTVDYEQAVKEIESLPENTNNQYMLEGLSIVHATEEVVSTAEISTEDLSIPRTQTAKEIDNLLDKANQYQLEDLPKVQATEEVVSTAEISTEDLSIPRKQTAKEIDNLLDKANQYQLEDLPKVQATEEVVSTAESSDGYIMDHTESKKPSEYYEILNEEAKNNTILDLSIKEEQIICNLQQNSSNRNLMVSQDPIPTIEEPSVNVTEQPINNTNTLYYNKDEKSTAINSSEYENNSKTSLQFFVDIALTQETLPVKGNEDFKGKDIKVSTSSIMENNDETVNNEEADLIKPRRKPKSENVRRIRRRHKVNEDFENKRITRSRSHQIVNKAEAKVRDAFDILKDSTTYNVQDFKSTSELPPGVNNVYTRVESNITSEDSNDFESVLHITEPEVISVYDEDTMDDDLIFIQSGNQTSVCISIPETEMASGSRKFDILFEMESYFGGNEGKLSSENIETTTNHPSVGAEEEARGGVPEVKALSTVPTDHSIEKVLNLTCSAHTKQNCALSEELHSTSQDENVIEEDCNNKIESAEVVVPEGNALEEDIVDNTNFKVDYSRIETLAADEYSDKLFKTKAQVKSYSDLKDEDLQKSKRIKVGSSSDEDKNGNSPISQRPRTKSINSDIDEGPSVLKEVPIINDGVMSEETTIKFVEQTEVVEVETEVVEELENTVIEKPTEIVQSTEIIESSEVKELSKEVVEPQVEPIKVVEPTATSDQTELMETTVVEQIQINAQSQIAVETEIEESIETEVTTDIVELSEVVQSTEIVQTAEIVEPTEVVKSSVIVELPRIVEEQSDNLTTITDILPEPETPASKIDQKTSEILHEGSVLLIETETPPKSDKVTDCKNKKKSTDTVVYNELKPKTSEALIEDHLIEKTVETPLESDSKNKNKSKETPDKNKAEQKINETPIDPAAIVENKIKSSPKSDEVGDSKNKKKSRETPDKNKVEQKNQRITTDVKSSEKFKSKDTSKSSEVIQKERALENTIKKMKEKFGEEAETASNTDPLSQAVNEDKTNPVKDKTHRDKRSYVTERNSKKERDYHRRSRSSSKSSLDDKKSHYSDSFDNEKSSKRHKRSISKSRHDKHKREGSERKASSSSMHESKLHLAEKLDATNKTAQSPKQERKKSDVDESSKKKRSHSSTSQTSQLKETKISSEKKPKHESSSKTRSRSSHSTGSKNKDKAEELSRDAPRSKETSASNIAISKENINTEKMSESVGATTGEIYDTISPEISTVGYEQAVKEIESLPENTNNQCMLEHLSIVHATEEVVSTAEISTEHLSLTRKQTAKEIDNLPEKANQYQLEDLLTVQATEEVVSTAESSDGYPMDHTESKTQGEYYEILNEEVKNNTILDLATKEEEDSINKTAQSPKQERKKSDVDETPKKKRSHSSTSQTSQLKETKISSEKKLKHESSSKTRSKSSHSAESKNKDKSEYIYDISDLFKCSSVSPHEKTDGDKQTKSKSEHRSHRSHSKEKSKSSSSSKSEKKPKDKQKDNEKKKSTEEVLPNDDKISKANSKSKETTATPTTTTAAVKQDAPQKHIERDNKIRESRTNSPKKRKHDSDDDNDRKKFKSREKSSSKTPKLDSSEQLLTESNVEKVDKCNDKKKAIEASKHALIKPNETQIVNNAGSESPTKQICKEELVVEVEKTNTLLETSVEKEEVVSTSTTLTDDDKEPIVCPDAASNEFAKMLMEKYNQSTCVPEVVTDEVQPKPIYISDCTLSEINTEIQEISPINTIIKNFSSEANNESALNISNVNPTAVITENGPTRAEAMPSCSTDELPNTEIFASAITLDEISPTKLHMGSNQSLDLISLPTDSVIDNRMNFVNPINFLNNVQTAEIVIADTNKSRPVSSDFVRGTTKIFMEVKGSATDHNYTFGDPLLSGNKEDQSILREVFNMDDISCNAIDDYFKKENIGDTDSISIDDDADPEAKPEEIQNMIKTLNQLVDKPKPPTTSVDIITIDHNSLDHTPTTDSNNTDYGVKYAFKEICSLRSKEETTNHQNATFPPIFDINKVNIIHSGAEQPPETTSILNPPSTINLKDIEYPTDPPSIDVITNYMDLLPSSTSSNPKVIVQRNEPYPIIMSAETKKEPIPKSNTSDIIRSNSNLSNDNTKAKLDKTEKTPPTKFIESVRKSSKIKTSPSYLNEPEKLYVRKNTRTPVCTNVRKTVSRQSSSGSSFTKNDSEVLFFAENLNKHEKRYMLHTPEPNKSRIRVKADLMDTERNKKTKTPESNRHKLPDLPQDPRAKCISSNHKKQPDLPKNSTKCTPASNISSMSDSPIGMGSSSSSHILDVRRRKYHPADSDPVQHHKKLKVVDELKDKGPRQRFSSASQLFPETIDTYVAPEEKRKQWPNHTYSPLLNPYNVGQRLSMGLGGAPKSSKSDPHVSQSHFDRPQERRSSTESYNASGLFDNEFTNKFSELLMKEDIFPTAPTRSTKY